MSLKGISSRFILALAMVLVLATPWSVQAQAQAVHPQKPPSEVISPQALPQGFAKGIGPAPGRGGLPKSHHGP
jgi:hypothetical protein